MNVDGYWRIQAHESFDLIWKYGIMFRQDAYAWLASKLKIKISDCHIKKFDKDRCRLVISLSEEFLREKKLMTTIPPPVRRSSPNLPPPQSKKVFGFRKLEKPTVQRVIIYGSGGIGKTSLACSAPGPVAVFDFDQSLDILSDKISDVMPIDGVESWADMMEALKSDLFRKNKIKTILIDSATAAERLCIAHCLKNQPNEKGAFVTSIEGYGYGKGYTHVYENFLALPAVLDTHYKAGINVVLICHDCTTNVPNPSGDDFIRYEPRMQSPTSGKNSIRSLLKEWADHLLFIGYDVSVKDGKGEGSGTRTIYPAEMPTHLAKSRILADPIVYEQGSDELWKNLGLANENA